MQKQIHTFGLNADEDIFTSYSRFESEMLKMLVISVDDSPAAEQFHIGTAD